MKNIDGCIGKYYCINNSTYIYIFPGVWRSRLRTDDMETISWQEHRRIGAGYVPGGWHQDPKLVLFYDVDSKESIKQMKPGEYKAIKKTEWLKGLIRTIFSLNFKGIQEGVSMRDKDGKATEEYESFFNGLDKIK